MAPRKSKRVGKRSGKKSYIKKRKTARKFMKGGVDFSTLDINIPSNSYVMFMYIYRMQFEQFPEKYVPVLRAKRTLSLEGFEKKVNGIIQEKKSTSSTLKFGKDGFYYSDTNKDGKIEGMNILIDKWNLLQKEFKDSDRFTPFLI